MKLRRSLLLRSIALAAFTSACAGEETIALTTSSGGSSGTGIGGFGTGGCDGSTADQDGDGYAKEQGDCNDCDPNSSPASVEVPASGADEDCDGEIDEDESEDHCDHDLLTDSLEPLDGARAIDLCKTSTGDAGWGVVSAKWSQMDGSAAPAAGLQKQRFDRGHGLVTNFGTRLVPRFGDGMLVLSTGEARDLDDPQSTKAFGYANPIIHKWYSSGPPDGFPKPVASCQDQDPPLSTGAMATDSIALELEVRTPANAHGFSFEHYYLLGSWPLNCFEVSPFLALLEPFPAEQFDGNIVFDATGDYIGQPATIRACGCDNGPPCKVFSVSTPPMDVACPLGDADLLGTGFGRDGGDPGGGTGWQTTQAPVEPNSLITLRLTIGQGGDIGYDATVIVDNWRWLLEPGVVVQTIPQ